MIGILLQVGRGRWLAIAAGLLVAFLPTSALNSASNFSGVAAASWWSISRCGLPPTSRRGAGARSPGWSPPRSARCDTAFIPACGALLAAYRARALRGTRRQDPRRERLAFVGAAAVAFAVTIAPWSLASLIASHTPLFPLIKGTIPRRRRRPRRGGAKLAGRAQGDLRRPAAVHRSCWWCSRPSWRSGRACRAGRWCPLAVGRWPARCCWRGRRLSIPATTCATWPPPGLASWSRSTARRCRAAAARRRRARRPPVGAVAIALSRSSSRPRCRRG